MRKKFPFYGITAPNTKPIFRELFKNYGKFTEAALIDFVRLCFENEYREIHYLGISKIVSLHFSRFPKQIKPVTRRWMDSENIWLQRVAIIFQRYKNYPTDEALLYQYIFYSKSSRLGFTRSQQRISGKCT